MTADVPSYELHPHTGGKPIKAWTRGVPVDDAALRQLTNAARLPFIHEHIAAMPDVHVGIGATVGSVIPTVGAIIPAAVGVDIGCGMMAVRTSLEAGDLPDSLKGVREAIELAVPHGRTAGMSKTKRAEAGLGKGKQRGRKVSRRDKGSWGEVPREVGHAWRKAQPGMPSLEERFEQLSERFPRIAKSNHVAHLGTLGSGNHFIEVCLDEEDRVWVMLHSGSRGVGNKIGTHFIELAKRDAIRNNVRLPDRDLAYFEEGAEHFDAYVEAVGWAQDFARTNRELMMAATLAALQGAKGIKAFTWAGAKVRSGIKPIDDGLAVNCHHNYVTLEHHFGQDCYVTRKGAVRAGAGELGIIPGSMGAKSFIVRGRGNAESFHSCSHGAGRVMSRSAAKRKISVEQHVHDTRGVECRKDAGVVDESPRAYKPIEAVMAAQDDLVEIVHTLRQVVCVKG
jgi:tRNA-splicing ligase RtcB